MGIKKYFAPVDMTVGKPWKSIVTFAVPMVIGNIAQQLYSTVDSIVVGQYAENGDNALAAVGNSLPIFNLLLVLFVGISSGVGIMVSQYFGAKQREDLSRTIGTSVTVTAICSLFLMILAPLVVRWVLIKLNTPKEILEDSVNYLVILMYGVAGMAYYNILSGILRGLGDSFSALVYLLVATVINTGLDIYFVKELQMGVRGVSLATVIAQFISSALCMWKLMHMKQHFDLKPMHFKISKKHLKQIVRLGIPSGLTQAIFSSAMLVVQSLTNSFGVSFVAANNIVMRIDGFAMMPNFSFGIAMTTFAGQNIGAKKMNRVFEGAKQGTLIAVGCSAFVTLVIVVCGRWLMPIFTDTPEVIETGVIALRILAVGYIAMAVTQSLSGVMRGAGDTLTPMLVSLCTTVFMRIPVAYGLVWLTKSEANPDGIKYCIQISLLATWVAGGVLTAIMYRIGKWKQKSLK